MGQLLALVIVLALVLAVLRVLDRIGALTKAADAIGGAPPRSLPFRRKDYLLTRAERALYEQLLLAVGPHMLIFAKVRLVDLLWLPTGVAGRQGLVNRVMSKHVDFVLCDRQNIRPLLAIELDDASHQREDRRARDALVDQILRGAQLPILHIRARASYEAQDLANQIWPLIQQR
jgi:hypothetical protein